MNRIFQVKLFSQSREIVRISVHIVTIPRLGRTAVPAPVMRDDSITLLAEKQHLSVPVVRGERPAVAEHHGLPGSPIFVVDLRSVFCSDCRHDTSSFLSDFI